MEMNNRGEMMWFSLITAFVIFAAGVLVINLIKDDVDTTRSGLDCTQSTMNLTSGEKLTCLGVDLVVPYVIVLILSIVGGVIIDRFLA